MSLSEEEGIPVNEFLGFTGNKIDDLIFGFTKKSCQFFVDGMEEFYPELELDIDQTPVEDRYSIKISGEGSMDEWYDFLIELSPDVRKRSSRWVTYEKTMEVMKERHSKEDK